MGSFSRARAAGAGSTVGKLGLRVSGVRICSYAIDRNRYSLGLLVLALFREVIPLDLGNRDLTRLPHTPRLVIQVLLQQFQTLQGAKRTQCLGGFMSDHFSLKVVGVDKDGFQVRNGGWTSDLAEHVGEFMLEKGRGVGEAYEADMSTQKQLDSQI
jgi:hypothetical protein